MTAPAVMTMPSTDEELLTEEARRQRQSRGSGRSQAGMLALAVFLCAAGYLMTAHPGAITYSMPYASTFPLGALLSAFGVLSILAGVILVLGVASAARPRARWGDPLPGDCPACGQPALRQDDIVRWEAGNTLKAAASGTVTLCETPGCPYAIARPEPR